MAERLRQRGAIPQASRYVDLSARWDTEPERGRRKCFSLNSAVALNREPREPREKKRQKPGSPNPKRFTQRVSRKYFSSDCLFDCPFGYFACFAVSTAAFKVQPRMAADNHGWKTACGRKNPFTGQRRRPRSRKGSWLRSSSGSIRGLTASFRLKTICSG